MQALAFREEGNPADTNRIPENAWLDCRRELLVESAKRPQTIRRNGGTGTTDNVAQSALGGLRAALIGLLSSVLLFFGLDSLRKPHAFWPILAMRS
jgi:hypothetical protein